MKSNHTLGSTKNFSFTNVNNTLLTPLVPRSARAVLELFCMLFYVSRL